MPRVSGILETALYVKDVATSAAFYRRIFEFDVLLESDRLIALNVAGKDVLLLFAEGATKAPVATPGGVIPGHAGAGPTHFAFLITSEDVEPWRKRLAEQNIPIESEVEWDGGARSIYFRDADQNLVELITAGFWKF
jgi:catechol 2,3-dioxygenase-like lactoylglutathione lyase family enzyme